VNVTDPSLPLVTIVTPSFNQAQFIRETIDSVLDQDYPNVEYIVVDGASTDQTAEVVKPYLSRLTYISEPDYGQTHAINKGFAMARGEIVAWLNSDDVFLPGAVSRAVAALQANPEAAVVYGEGYLIDAQSNVKERFPYTQHFDLWKLVYLSDYILQQSVFFRKSALEIVGPLREDLNFVMDWEILIRLGKKYEFVRLEEYMGSLREYEAAKTSAGGVARAHEIWRMLRAHCGSLLPPGFVTYGFVTYEREAVKAIDRWPEWLGFLRTAARKLVTRFFFFFITKATTYGQAWHRDGWMAPRARVMLCEGSGEAFIAGVVPGGVPGLIKQRVQVFFGKHLLAEEELSPGKFEIRFTVPPSVGCPVFTLVASESFVLAKLGTSSDKRQLSLRLLSAGWLNQQSVSSQAPLLASA